MITNGTIRSKPRRQDCAGSRSSLEAIRARCSGAPGPQSMIWKMVVMEVVWTLRGQVWWPNWVTWIWLAFSTGSPLSCETLHWDVKSSTFQSCVKRLRVKNPSGGTPCFSVKWIWGRLCVFHGHCEWVVPWSFLPANAVPRPQWQMAHCCSLWMTWPKPASEVGPRSE